MSYERSDNLSQLWDQATFMPHDLAYRSDMLVQSVAKKLQTNFVAFCLYVSVAEPDSYSESGLSDQLARFQYFDFEKKRHFVEYPLFRIWLKQATRALESRVGVKERLSTLKQLMDAFEKHDPDITLETDCGSIELVRFYPDRLIQTAVEADYSFPDESRRHELEAAYPISAVVQTVQEALERVRFTWFAAFKDFFKFVKIIVDLVDANFKSYSSHELTGIIMVSTNNAPVLVEEYLIHELGHQILDNVMELDSLVVKEETRKTFSLPWSGKQREIYGYLHAFFIYLMLYNYYRMVKVRSVEEESIASHRLAEIGDGLVRAMPELEYANLFTPRGKELFDNLKGEAYRLGLN